MYEGISPITKEEIDSMTSRVIDRSNSVLMYNLKFMKTEPCKEEVLPTVVLGEHTVPITSNVEKAYIEAIAPIHNIRDYRKSVEGLMLVPDTKLRFDTLLFKVQDIVDEGIIY
jgi:hypothetical protein